MASPHFSIVIIGGALSGTSVLIHLAERFRQAMHDGRVQVHLVERSGEIGKGLAWSDAMASDCQLSNLPVAALRLSETTRPTFEDWLQATHPNRFGTAECLAAAYPPRRYFGDYVQAMLQRWISEPGVHMHAGTEALSIVPEHSGAPYRVSLGTGAELSADCVILCTGPATSGSGRDIHGLAGHPGYLESPWPAGRLTDAVRGATGVAVLGTGLTGIDVVKHLHAAHRGIPTVLTSRQGRFNVVARDLRRPEVADQPPYACRVLTPEVMARLPLRISLEDCTELVRQEIEACVGAIHWQQLLGPEIDGVAEWRRHVRSHRAGHRSRWQLALMAIEDVVPLLWRRLSDSDRERWMTSGLRTVFQNYSNPLPIESAERVLSLIDAGDVVVRGGLRGVEPLEGGFLLRYETPPCEVHVSHCVNATGVGFDVTRDRSPLMRQLLRDGILSPHRCGGVIVDPDTFRVPGTSDMYVVGDGARGVRYLTSGLGFQRSMVRAVVGSIARQPTPMTARSA